MHDFKWSDSEKKLARRVFDTVVAAELDETIGELKRRAAAVVEVDEMWDLEKFLRRRRGEIERKYDYRYSQIPFVLGVLLREGRIKEAELSGLSEDKLNEIRGFASL